MSDLASEIFAAAVRPIPTISRPKWPGSALSRFFTRPRALPSNSLTDQATCRHLPKLLAPSCMNKLLSVLALVAAVLGGALVIGIQRFVPRQIDVARAKPIRIDVDAAVQRLSRAIRHRTVSSVDSASPAEFERFHAFLTESFPAVHKRLARETVNSAQPAFTLGKALAPS